MPLTPPLAYDKNMRQVFRNALIIFTLIRSVTAADFFVAPNATPNGDGTAGNPWRLETALSPSPAVHPGDTIWLRGGTYHAPNSNGFNSQLNGTPAQPITVRNYPGERATIDGKGTEFALDVTGIYTWFWGLEVMDSTTQRSVSTPGSGTHPNAFGVAVYGQGNKFINMIVHDTAEGFSAYDMSPDTEFNGNVVYYNGWVGPDRPHGHGMYLQNVTGIKTVADNIIGDNFDEGIQIYGSGTANVIGFRVTGNTLYNTSSLPTPNYQFNLIVTDGSVRKDIQVQNNYSFFTPSADYGFVQFGQDTNGNDISVTGNVFVGGYIAVGMAYEAGPVTFTGNTVYTRPTATQLVNLKLNTGQNLSQYTWDNNTYYGLNQFFYGINLNFTGWHSSTGFDANSTMNPNAPSGTWVFVRPNQYEPKRANITIYNWDSKQDISVDLSSILSTGDKFVIRDAQNYFGFAVLDGTYPGGSVTIPLTSLRKATPIGVAAPAHTAPLLGTFVVTVPEASQRPGTPHPPIPRR
ncbi:MAG: right-handed parallel beta-helix repeat-containing protein [Acidobacteriia bacterium]|nr:right-handed parallel beta-helix repeat-containing protein [Terriglobia bacterium]